MHQLLQASRCSCLYVVTKSQLWSCSRTSVSILLCIHVQVWSLLVLDPNERTQALREALLSGHGWQRKLKRGLHALR